MDLGQKLVGKQKRTLGQEGARISGPPSCSSSRELRLFSVSAFKDFYLKNLLPLLFALWGLKSYWHRNKKCDINKSHTNGRRRAGGGAVLHKMRSRWRQSHVVTWTGTLPLIHSLTWCLFVCVREFTFERKDLGGMLTEGLITVASKKTVSKGLFLSFCEPVQWSSFFNGKYKIRAIRPRVWLRDLLFFLESTLVIVRLMVHQYCSRLSVASMYPRCVDLHSCSVCVLGNS